MTARREKSFAARAALSANRLLIAATFAGVIALLLVVASKGYVDGYCEFVGWSLWFTLTVTLTLALPVRARRPFP